MKIHKSFLSKCSSTAAVACSLYIRESSAEIELLECHCSWFSLSRALRLYERRVSFMLGSHSCFLVSSPLCSALDSAGLSAQRSSLLCSLLVLYFARFTALALSIGYVFHSRSAISKNAILLETTTHYKYFKMSNHFREL